MRYMLLPLSALSDMVFIPNNELVHYLVTKDLGSAGLPARVQSQFERIEMMLAHDPILKARLDALRERLDALPSFIAPASRFEQLTGHRLPTLPLN